jgi:type IV conjugative transfer system protein TraL
MSKEAEYIPRTQYIDGISEVGGIIPYDVFLVFFVSFMFTMMVIRSAVMAPILAIVMGVAYYRFKRRFNRNFYLTIPYYLGFRNPKGVPPVTESEFIE